MFVSILLAIWFQANLWPEKGVGEEKGEREREVGRVSDFQRPQRAFGGNSDTD